MKVEVYGGDHSPWVQAVLLALHEKGIDHRTCPTLPLEALRHHDRLNLVRQWIGNMQARFSDYSHLYSGKYFEPHQPQPSSENAMQRFIFFFGLLTMFVLLPLTLSLVFVLLRKVLR